MDPAQIQDPWLEGHLDGREYRGSSGGSRLAPSAKGITDKDFTLAKKIEEVVGWQPGKEGGPLEGTPNGDQRFAYIKYDS